MSYLAVNQAAVFLVCALAGAASGAAFDVTRALRKFFRHKAALVWLEDALWWAVTLVIVFYAMLRVNFADLRVYNIVGAGLGAIIYFGSVSRVVMGVTDAIVKALRKVRDKVSDKVKKVVSEVKKRVRKRFEAAKKKRDERIKTLAARKEKRNNERKSKAGSRKKP